METTQLLIMSYFVFNFVKSIFYIISHSETVSFLNTFTYERKTCHQY